MIDDRPKPDYRVGIGTDIHETETGKALMLCGIYIPYPIGLKGHSDGDVGIHAIIDALLGASGNGDIGTLFPDTDPEYKDIDSKELLATVRDLLNEQGWDIVNVDVTIHAEAPKLTTIKGQMKRCVSGILGINFCDVNIKAKTNEGLGDIGEGDAMAATAIALIKKKYKRSL